MPTLTTADLLEALRQTHVLDADRLGAVAGDPRLAGAGPRDLARELIGRGWLTPYQANHLLQGRGRELVLGSYLLLERLGEGGMGQVFKARHVKLGRVVALKVIKKERLDSPDMVLRFRREIRAAAVLSHPNVVTAFDAEEVGGAHFLAMEYVEGTDLGKVVKQHGPLPVRQACDYVRQAALGLQHAFERGLVHRDVKPSNLLLSARDGTVKVLDLGLARLGGVSEKEDSSLVTETGEVMGTPDYMAPEQAEGSHDVDTRADVYSLGCTLYHLLTGRVPFPGGSAAAKLARRLSGEPAAVEALRPEVPPGLGAVVRKMMARRPADRHPTPGAAAADLAAWLAGRPVAPPPSPAAPADPFRDLAGGGTAAGASRGGGPRRALWLSGAGAAALVGLAALGWSALRPAPAPPPGPERAGSSPLDGLRAEQVPAAERVRGQPPQLVAVLGDHGLRHRGTNGVVRGVACGPDGATVASVGQEGVVRLWDARTGRERASCDLSGQYLNGVAFHPGGRRLAVCGDDGKVHVLTQTEAGLAELYSLTGPRARVSALAFTACGDWLASAGHDHAVRVWDLGLEPPKGTALAGHDKEVNAVAFAPDGRTLASAGDDCCVRLWRRDGDGWQAGPRLPHDGPVRCVAVAPDGRTLAAGEGPWVRLWDVGEGPPRRRAAFQARGAEVAALAFAPDGETLAVAAGRVQFWRGLRTPDPVPAGSPDGQECDVQAVALAPGGDLLVAGGADHSVRLWRREGGAWRPHLPPRGHTLPVQALAFAPDGRARAVLSPDGRTLASVGADRRLTWWDVSTGARRGECRLPLEAFSLAFAPDGRHLAVGNDNGTLYVLRLPP